MAFTLQSVMDAAGTDLNDPASGGRWSATDRLSFCNDGLAMAKSLRPDLFLATLGVDYTALAVDATAPLPDVYKPALVAYVKGRCLKKNTDARNLSEADAQIKFAIEVLKSL